MSVDLAKRRALLAAATPGPWESEIDLLDDEDGLAFTVTDATYKMFGILPTEFPNTPAGSASAYKHPAAANAVLIVGLVNEEPEILDELERLRVEAERWQVDRTGVLRHEEQLTLALDDQLEELARLRRFRDAVMASDHAWCCGKCNGCRALKQERTALAKENG